MASTYEALLLAQANFFSNVPECICYQAAAQSLTSGTVTAAIFDTNIIDPYTMHSTVTNNTRVTAVVPGRYTIIGVGSYAPNATGARSASLRLNGATNVPASGGGVPTAGAAFATNVLAQADVFFNVGDYVELMLDQNSGGALLTQAVAPNNCGLTVRWARQQ